MSAIHAALVPTPPPPSYSSFPKTPSVFAPTTCKVYDVPMWVICRPLPSELDEAKVQLFMRDIQSGDQFTPIEVLRCLIPSTGLKYYFAFGGCHRFEAYKRLKSPTVPGTIINVPPGAIRLVLGSSCPF